jgi:hypothetical protein
MICGLAASAHLANFRALRAKKPAGGATSPKPNP